MRAPTLAPPVVASPERYADCVMPASVRFLRFSGFLLPGAAAALQRELAVGLRYELVELPGLSRQWRGEREAGDGYFGRLQTVDGWRTPPVVDDCLALFTDPWFLDFLSRMTGLPLIFKRPATPYRMQRGDRIMLHDDLGDPTHRLSVVLNLSEGWRREYGGNTVIGRVARIESLPTPPELPFPLQRWYLTRSRATLTPKFNSVTLLRLAPGLAHGVTPVRVDRPRLSLTCIYGVEDAWPGEPDAG